MVNDKNIQKAIDIIFKQIITPIIYMVEHNNRVDFVYVCDVAINDEILDNIQHKLKNLLLCDVELIDIELFSAIDKLELIQKAKLIYCENPSIQKLFEFSTVTDLQNIMDKKREVIKRKNDYGAFYLQ